MQSNFIKRPNSKHEVLPCTHCQKRKGWKAGGLCVRCHQDPEIRDAHGVVMVPRNKTAEERFWEKVRKTDGCWEWTACRSRFGYGKFGAQGRGRNPVEAHRFSYELANGSIPDGLCVLHHCDNPACIRPDHLFLGTRTDNAEDRQRKGRTATGDRCGSRLHPERVRRGDNHPSRLHPERLARGEDCPWAKLTEAAVLDIRARFTAGQRQCEIARELGLTNGFVWGIVRGKSWKHL